MDELLNYYQMLMEYAEVNASQMSIQSQQALAQLISQFTQIIEMESNEPPPIEEIEQEEAEIAEQVSGQPPQQPPRGPAPAIGLTKAMPSSNIESFSYNPKTENLYVRFLGDYPNRQGPIYQYEGVPIDIYKIFRKGSIPAKTTGENSWGEWYRGKIPSIGAAMAALIKAGGFPYQRLS